jgi:hypothetical protein
MALPSRAEMGTGDGHQAGLGDQLAGAGVVKKMPKIPGREDTRRAGRRGES